MNETERKQIIDKFFYKTNLYWIRYKGQYRFNNEEMNLAIDHYIETGQEP
jgi:hypothetical protein